jgi:hypothetical protein
LPATTGDDRRARDGLAYECRFPDEERRVGANRGRRRIGHVAEHRLAADRIAAAHEAQADLVAVARQVRHPHPAVDQQIELARGFALLEQHGAARRAAHARRGRDARRCRGVETAKQRRARGLVDDVDDGVARVHRMPARGPEFADLHRQNAAKGATLTLTMTALNGGNAMGKR